MPEALGSPPSPRAALFWNGTAWQWALVDAAGHLQIDVVDAAGLQDALQSVATDRLIVRGEDQLFSIEETVLIRATGIVSGANGFFDTPVVGANRYWVITTVVAYDTTSPTTAHDYYIRRGATDYYFYVEERAIAANSKSVWGGRVILATDDRIRVYFQGALVGDAVRVHVTGYQMTLEV